MPSDPQPQNAVPTRPSRRSVSNRFAAIVRWLHIYVSLLSFTALVFFGITGITLNHPTWFGADSQRVTTHEGRLKSEWLPALPEQTDEASDADPSVAKLEIVEYLRSQHGLRGSVSEFRTDERECLVLFKGPGYAADVVIDRASCGYSLTVTSMGAVAMMNDFHKGRDTGGSWSIVIDLVSVMTVFVSVTGLLLIFYIRRKRLAGILTAVAGTLILIAVAIWLVP